MPAHSGIKLVFGAGGFSSPGAFADATNIPRLLDVLEKGGCTTLDTAQIYGADGGSESLIGETKAHERVTVDTKHAGGAKAGSATEEGVVKDCEESLKRLGVDKVDIYYIHMPDTSVDIASTLAGINTLHRKGRFQRFGLSNYTVEQVQEVYDHAREKGYVLPTVYQGNYNPVARRYEQLLFPTLRKLGIAFYAYSPLAGGFLAKTKAQIEEGVGRFGKESFVQQMYRTLYAKPELIDILGEWSEKAKEEGMTGAEMAYRYVRFNSILSPEHGDAIIFGSKNVDEAKQTLEWLNKGPVSEGAEKYIDDVWSRIEHVAPLDNISAMQELAKGPQQK